MNWGFETKDWTRALFVAALLCLSATRLRAAQPWNKDPQHWTTEDARHVLLDSPWALAVSATFGPQRTPADMPPAPLPGAAEAGIAGPRPNSGANWDGGPGRDISGRTPTLMVTVRWDSALPLREAILKLPASDRSPGDVYTAAQLARDYILTVTGLVPAGRYTVGGQLKTESKSSSDESDSVVGPQDPEPLLEGLMGSSSLTASGRPPIRPEDVKLDAATGTLHLFFPRTSEIGVGDKEAVFSTQFGSMRVTRKFRLKEMRYGGRLEL